MLQSLYRTRVFYGGPARAFVSAASGSGTTFILTEYGLSVLRSGAVLSLIALALVVAGLLFGFEGGFPDRITQALAGTGAVLIGFSLILVSWTLDQARRARRGPPASG